ncbi:hypothetical protein IWQ61_001526 [Dispira simplex]|nr:hypothetical protein IWQ61_001526 [Dispira simplex]
MPWTIDTQPVEEFSQSTQLLNETQDPTQATLGQTSQQKKPVVVGKLIGTRGGEAPRDYPLVLNQTLVIGRHRSCDVVIQGGYCSNHHCRIIVKPSTDEPQGFATTCQDLSSNGTYLNRRKVGRNNTVVLSHGDTLEIRKGYYFTFLQTYTRNGPTPPEQQGEQTVEDKYQVTNRILGTGTFAQVRLAIHKATGQRLAVKMIDRQRFNSMSTKQHGTDFVQEIRIMQSIDHPNIVRVADVIRTDKYWYIFMPCVQGGDLFEYIMSQDRLPELEAKFICYQILLALKYLHERNISHRDVKPENILLTARTPYSLVMLTDFGMARIVGNQSFMQTMCGTFQYIAPEVIDVNTQTGYPGERGIRGYNKAVDSWSLGVLLYAMLSGTLPFSSSDDNNALLFREIKAGKIAFPSKFWGHVSEEAKSMVRCLLVVDPSRRYTVHDALDHRWIKSEGEHLLKSYTHALVNVKSIPETTAEDGPGPSIEAPSVLPPTDSYQGLPLPSSPVPCNSPLYTTDSSTCSKTFKSPLHNSTPHLASPVSKPVLHFPQVPNTPALSSTQDTLIDSPLRKRVRSSKRQHPYTRSQSASRV